MRTPHSPSMTANRATSHEGWSQKWLHVSENRVFYARSSAYGVLDGLPWAQGVAGSNPVAPTTFRICRSHTGHTVKSLECGLPAASSMRLGSDWLGPYVEGCCRLRSAKERTRQRDRPNRKHRPHDVVLRRGRRGPRRPPPVPA